MGRFGIRIRQSTDHMIRYNTRLENMKCATLLIAAIALSGADAFNPCKCIVQLFEYSFWRTCTHLNVDRMIMLTPASHMTNPAVELKKAAASTFAALAIGSNVLGSPFAADAAEPFAFSSTNVVAEKVVRQGLYQDYEVDITQSVDDASSNFKSAKETKTKKGN